MNASLYNLSEQKALSRSSMNDAIFAADHDGRTLDFKFDDKVAHVFDDMVSRSVPFYDEIQRMSCELAADFAQPGTNMYDLGCSTGTSFLALHSLVDPDVRFVGYDNSDSMLQKATDKLKEAAPDRSIAFRYADIEKSVPIENASVVMMVLTLQFVRPLYREKLIRTIYEGMNKDASLIVVEKLTFSNLLLNRLYIEHYYDHKRRQGYSDIEITRKREALENVLIPYRMEENTALLKEAGFRDVEEYFRWYNFSAFIAIK